MTRRAVYAAGWAILCALVLTRVTAGFERIRVRVVTSPLREEGRSIAVALPDLARLAGRPVAIIMRLAGAGEPAQVRVSLDGAPVAEVALPAGRAVRVDASAMVPAGAGHQLTLTGDGSGWQLRYLEIANVHGHSSGLFGFSVVPRQLDAFDRVSLWWLWPVGLGLLAWRRPPGWALSRPGRVIVGIFATFVIFLFLTVLFIDRVTPFKVLLTFGTFLWCAAIVHAGSIAGFARFVSRRTKPALPVVFAFLRNSRHGVTAVANRRHTPAALAGCAAIAVLVAALALGSHVAGGADAYGYVSQSALWARGQLYVDQPIAADLPDYLDDWAIAPLGYVPQPASGVRGRIVPLFSPGLPMLMAPFRLLFGPAGGFVVVPLLAALAVWLTFVAGRRLEGSATGLVAALWLAVSPAFLASAFAPMSDVPAAALWLAALVASFRPGVTSAAVAGLATAGAVLVRPNLVPLGAVVAVPFILRALRDRAEWRTHRLAVIVFLITAAAGPVVAGVTFNRLFGSPFVSGYGTAAMNVDWSNVLPNLGRYPRWLIESQTVFVLAGVAAPFLLRGRPATNGWLRPSAIAWLMLAASSIVWMSYLLYFQFDSWMYLRFLLPSYPLLIALASAVLVILVRRFPAPRVVGTAVVAGLLFYELDFDTRHSLLERSSGEARYEIVGEFVRRALPERAVVLSAQHSGSVRYYSGRTTLRYDQVPSGRLDELVSHLQARGYPVFIVLDSWEVDEWRQRFGSQTEVGGLGWPPAANLKGSTDVLIYDVTDRRRPTPVQTQTIR